MKQSRASLLRALLFAVTCAGAYATVDLFSQSVCGSPLACFEAGQEGEIWQALTPFGETNAQPSYAGPNLIAGCDNSEHPVLGRTREDSRLCIRDDEGIPPSPYPVPMPPPLGQMLDPFALAVDGERIYVSDQSNHRVQAFKFDGTPIKIAYPIGDGVRGSGPYPAYPPDSRMTGHGDPITGQRIYSPDGLAVDGARNLIVGDYSGYVNAFQPNGLPAFGTMDSPGRFKIENSLASQIPNFDTKASGIALSPGTIVRGFNVTPPAGDTGRIVVTDRLNCFVYIYNSGFQLVRQIPDVMHPDAYQGACVWDEPGNTIEGVFDTPVAAAFDQQGRIYISEYGNNRIQILDPSGEPLGVFGGADVFQYPWGIVVDHQGRIAVADTENQRIAFFKVDYPGGEPAASFVFELDAKGTLNGSPTGIAEQVGTGEGLDPAGRLLATDTLNNRVQRFQLPDLTIINPTLNTANQTGTFQVVVPADKAAGVAKVGVSAVGVNATVQSLKGVAPANASDLDPTNTALENATEALGTDIAPRQIANYTFSYTAATEASVSFIFNAVGNGGLTSAEPQEVDVAAPCLTCTSVHTVYRRPASLPPTTIATSQAGWYNSELTIKIDASTTHPAGLKAIAFQFISGPEAAGLRWGGGINVQNVSLGAANGSITFDVLSEGVSSFRYWAIGADDTVEQSHFVTLSLDLTPPNVAFNFPTTPNAAGWYNGTHLPLGATFTRIDTRSGIPPPAAGSISFTHAGRAQYREESATDKAGNTRTNPDGSPWPFRSDLTANGGFPVNIDTNAPQLTIVPDDIVIQASGEHFGVIAPGAFQAQASDPLLVGDPRPGANLAGSGVASINNPTVTTTFPMGASSWPFTATDAAGNVSAVTTRTVTVLKAPSLITAPNTVEYGAPIPVTLSPSWATGSLTASVDGGAPFPVALSNGGASIALGALAYGSYSVAISYPGSDSVFSSTTTVQVAVSKRPLTVTAQNAGKAVNGAEPSLTYQITAGSLAAGDSFTGDVTRVAGELPGLYAITQGTLALSGNYELTFVPGTFTIDGMTVVVRADRLAKKYGTDDPTLSYSWSPGLPPGAQFSGRLTREPGDDVGNYFIGQGDLSLPPGFSIQYHSETFTIEKRVATVFSTDAGKIFGAADPPLFVDSTGFLPSDNIAISATRVTGENAGTYSILTQATGARLSNYDYSLQSSVFTIAPTRVTVTARPLTITYGDAAVFGFDYGTFPTGYSALNVVTPPTCGAASLAGGTRPITCVGAVLNNNVAFDYVDATLVVNRRNATITVNSTSRPFGAANPEFSATVGGLIAGDTLDYAFATSAVATSNVGPYDVTASVGEHQNYNVSVTNGTLTINPVAVSINANSKSKRYGEANPALDAVVTGGVDGAEVVYSLSTTADLTSIVGAYPISVTASALANPNYTVTTTDSSLEIGRLPITITAVAKNKTYGDAEPALTYTRSVALIGTDTVGGALTRVSGANVGSYAILQGSLALNENYDLTYVGANLTIAQRAITVTADAKSKLQGALDPALTYSITDGYLVEGDAITGALTRDDGDTLGTYAIRQGDLTAGSNYALSFISALLTILPNNVAPVANDDAAVVNGLLPRIIPVLVNDTDADGDVLLISSVTQPAGGVGSVAAVGVTIVFTPSSTFAGTATFTYTVTDGRGGFDTATVTVSSCNMAGFRTQSQGGWGTNPSGGNPGAFLAANFATVFPNGVQIGGTYTLRFTSATAVASWLPRGGGSGVLTANGVNPTSSMGVGVFGGQVLAFQISLDFSRRGVTRPGLEHLTLASGPLAGSTAGQVQAIANAVIGGNMAALPSGMTISGLSSVIESLNMSFHDGNSNSGYLVNAACSAPVNLAPVISAVNRVPNAVNDSASVVKGKSITINVCNNDTDPDGDTLTITAKTNPSKGSVSIQSGAIKYTAPSNWTGATTFTYTISDGKGGTDSATVTVTVKNHSSDDGSNDH